MRYSICIGKSEEGVSADESFRLRSSILLLLLFLENKKELFCCDDGLAGLRKARAGTGRQRKKERPHRTITSFTAEL